MGVLGSEEIRRRIDEIFSGKSWLEGNIQEASYDLRVAPDLMKVGGKVYPLGQPYPEKYLKIRPGEIALFSTMETFPLPGDLVGSIGIKFGFTRKGLSPLFGFQVDPFYGQGHRDERLYLYVSNLGPEPIQITLGQRVFNIEFHTVEGEARNIQKDRPYLAPRIEREATEYGSSSELGFLDTVRKEMRREFDTRLTSVEQGTQQIVIFGIFLVASALLAGSITALFAMVFSIDSSGQSELTSSLLTPTVRTILFSVALMLAISLLVLIISVLIFLYKSILGNSKSR